MPPPLSVTTAPSDAPPKITATHASSGGRGRGGHRGRRGARGGNSVGGSADGSGAEGPAASLLSRIGGRVDDASSTGGAESPTTPKAETKPKGSLSIQGASLPPKPPNGHSRRGSNARKSSTLTVGTSPSLPPKDASSSSDPFKPNSEKTVPQSAPSDRPTFPNVEAERPASALAVSSAKEASIRGVSPTPRLSWADDTDDDSLPDLDDWMTPALTPSAGSADGAKDDRPAGDDDEHTPVATNAPAGPLRERRKRGAGKKNKQLAARAAENAAAGSSSASLVTPKEEMPRSSKDASGLEESVAKLSLASGGKEKEKGKGKEKEPGVTTPKADWRSVIPDTGRDGAMQLLSALAGSITTTKSTSRPPDQQQADPAGSEVTPVAPAPKPAAIPAGPAASRVRAVPSPIPPSSGPSRPGPPAFNTRQAARGMNGMHHPGLARGGYRADPGDTPVTLPKKHARPVITADAITRLARGLMVAPPKHDHGDGSGGDGGKGNGSSAGS
ncbi:hypothetical protein CALVIDRAFT_535642 [Calocera viscosa TUFC12733]|uniref:Uncharacterized protein n=1 Tax=Calocera viscosa (strain TUFC12733) TaxID=1330018 RepID=A0A167NSZ1_CALVF|nr:hypothetical protein CALVIDRAFT_535642 [Calocera viscosa TUFC12733]